ncbi:MAG: esterase family protein [Firmicutes bacterium]|nr:esterase family protein [Bacillota bacterium]MCM1401236.1 esterase family protein [Bacteroides sp.]MCM1477215.1 esterase family protein [Bacteroides sp.]
MKKIFFFFALMASLFANATTERIVESKYITSPAQITIAVPDGYDEAITESFPVVYLLNGHGGNHKSWASIVNLDSLATVNNVIIVCPDGRNSWYWDSPIDSTMQMESYIVKELVPWVDRNYRTRPNAAGRAITGLSMGGHGGLWLGIRHPELFANIGSTSGGVDIRPFPKKWNMADRLGDYASNPKRWDNHTVATLVDSIKPGYYNIIFDCGTEDFFYKVNCNLDKALTKKGIKHTYLTGPGAHNPAYWRKSIQPQLRFFSDKFYPKKK